MDSADSEAIAALSHNNAVDAASVSMHISVAIVNALVAQPSIDARRFTHDLLSNLNSSADNCGEDQALAKWAMSLVAKTISDAYDEAVARASIKA